VIENTAAAAGNLGSALREPSDHRRVWDDKSRIRRLLRHQACVRGGFDLRTARRILETRILDQTVGLKFCGWHAQRLDGRIQLAPDPA
jgi:hypothetical protein